MSERTPILNNMSGMSRSTARVTPQRVEPPPIIAHGEKINSSTWAYISLFPNCNATRKKQLWDSIICSEALFAERLFAYLTKELSSEDAELTLREIAETKISEHYLNGCMIIQPNAGRFKHLIKNPLGSKHRVACKQVDKVLSFAILSKSSGSLFVASKTPNLTPELLNRSLLTNDPRILKILKGGP